jgi:hypothetical protein
LQKRKDLFFFLLKIRLFRRYSLYGILVLGLKIQKIWRAGLENVQSKYEEKHFKIDVLHFYLKFIVYCTPVFLSQALRNKHCSTRIPRTKLVQHIGPN